MLMMMLHSFLSFFFSFVRCRWRKVVVRRRPQYNIVRNIQTGRRCSIPNKYIWTEGRPTYARRCQRIPKRKGCCSTPSALTRAHVRTPASKPSCRGTVLKHHSRQKMVLFPSSCHLWVFSSLTASSIQPFSKQTIIFFSFSSNVALVASEECVIIDFSEFTSILNSLRPYLGTTRYYY